MLAALAGYLWVSWNYNNYRAKDAASGIDMCLFRRVTGLPCPSCGTTRSVLSISHLHFADALYYTPIGFIMVLGLLLLPLWIIADIVSRKSSFHRFYISSEVMVRKKWVAISLVCVVAGNWIWNIYKFTS